MGNTQGETLGYRVIKVAKDSPGDQAGLIPFFDFIIGVETPSMTQEQIKQQSLDFFTILLRSQDTEISLIIYNIYIQKRRIVKLTPNKSWPNADSLLGIMIRPEQYTDARDRIYRICNVQQYSPAKEAGLESDEDYLLGVTQKPYQNLEELIDYIQNADQNALLKSLEFCIYNTTKRTIRFTYVLPNKLWGGKGCIGCEFATGYLNVLPFLENDYELFNIIYPRELQTNSNIHICTNTNTSTHVSHYLHQNTQQTDDKDNIVHYQQFHSTSADPGHHHLIRKHSADQKDQQLREIIKNTHIIQNGGPEEVEVFEFHFDHLDNQQLNNNNSEEKLLNPRVVAQQETIHSTQYQQVSNYQQIPEDSNQIPISIEQRGFNLKDHIVEYKYDCKKIGGQYIIKSDELFDLGVALHKQN